MKLDDCFVMAKMSIREQLTDLDEKQYEIIEKHFYWMLVAGHESGKKTNKRRTRPVRQINSDGLFIDWPCITKAAAHHGVTRQAINNSITRGRKCCGANWQYLSTKKAMSV